MLADQNQARIFYKLITLVSPIFLFLNVVVGVRRFCGFSFGLNFYLHLLFCCCASYFCICLHVRIIPRALQKHLVFKVLGFNAWLPKSDTGIPRFISVNCTWFNSGMNSFPAFCITLVLNAWVCMSFPHVKAAYAIICR